MVSTAERLVILHEVADDLLVRAYEHRRELQLVEDPEAAFFTTSKVAKALTEKFPEDTLKEKEKGFDLFVGNCGTIVKKYAPFYELLGQLAEFRGEALRLLGEMSKEIVRFSLELNPLVFRGYFDLMVKYARLHLLVGHLLSPEGKGKLCLAAYAKAHAIANHVEPRGFLPLARYALDFERALPKLQEDLSNASLRVADALVPMQAKIIALSDANYLKGETVLAPVRPAAAAATGGDAGGAPPLTATKSMDFPSTMDALLPFLPSIKQWVVYGFLLVPEDLGEPNAVDLLMQTLSTLYVLPVSPTDSLQPHAEFDVDGKTLLKWLRSKDQVKAFQARLKESRLAAYRTAASAHLGIRISLVTKLAHLASFFQDAHGANAMGSRLPILLTGLDLARDEIEWWALHVDAQPAGLTKRQLDEYDEAAFNSATVQALVRVSMQLRILCKTEGVRLAELAGKRLGDQVDCHRERVDTLIFEMRDKDGNIGKEMKTILRDLPAFMAYACEPPPVDLRGMRLNILRVVVALSSAGGHAALQLQPKLALIMKELQAAHLVSRAIDEQDRLLAVHTDAAILLADPTKFGDRLFMGAIYSKPSDCVALLQLAVANKAPLPLLSRLLDRLEARLAFLLDAIVRHLNARRLGVAPPPPPETPPLQQASTQLCALCAALDRAPPLDFARSRLLVREWLREHLEIVVQREVGRLAFGGDSDDARLNPPTAALARLQDLTQALAMVRSYVSLDVFAMLNGLLAREFGMFEGVDAAALPAEATDDVRARGVSVADAERDSAVAARRAQAAAQGKEAPALFVDRLRSWLRRAVGEACAADGPTYLPSARRFSYGYLDAAQFTALCRLTGGVGMEKLNDELLGHISNAAKGLRAEVMKNKEPLAAFAKHFERSHTLPSEIGLTDMPAALALVHKIGVLIAVRSLLLAGLQAAKAQLVPASVASFVRGLGDQQLPDGRRAGQHLDEVAEVLATYGVPGGLHHDAQLQRTLAEATAIGSDTTLWRDLPCLFAFLFYLPQWRTAEPLLKEGAVRGNLHCAAFAYHALLSMLDPYVTPADGARVAVAKAPAHRTFFEVAALVLLQRRHEADGTPKGPDERPLASMALVLEQLIHLAEPLTYGDLQPFVPHALLAATYGMAWQREVGLGGLRIGEGGGGPEALPE